MSVAVTPIRRPAPRIVLSLVLVTLAVLVLVDEAVVRRGEAMIARGLVALVTQSRAVASGSIVYFGVDSPEVVGLDITALCSTAVLVIPLLTLASIIAMVTRARSIRLGVGLIVSLAIVIACNLARYASAAWAYTTYGMEGFDLVHRYLGSLFVIAGFVVAIVLLLRLTLRERRPRSARRAASPATMPRPSLPSPPAPAGSNLLRRDLRAHSQSERRAVRRKDRR